MAYVAPKESWVASDAPLPSDLNRIEGNNRANHEGIGIEASARSGADATLQNNINSEASARSGADATLQNNINTLQNNLNTSISNGILANIENRTSDPTSPSVGHMWIRIDL